MSVVGDQVPEALQIYDVIQFQEAKVEEISRLLFLIYHIEKSFGECLNLEKIVEKEKFKEELNEQFKAYEFKVFCPIQNMTKITEVSNKKLDFLFAFIQNSLRLKIQPSLAEAQNFIRGYLRRADEDNLMNDYFYCSKNLHLDEEQHDSKQ